MTDWAKLKVVDLKAELKKRDLPQHGLKAELVARLAAADEDETPPQNGGDAGTNEEEQAVENEAGHDGGGPSTEPKRDDEAAPNGEEPTPAVADQAEEAPSNDAPEPEPQSPTGDEPPAPDTSEAQQTTAGAASPGANPEHSDHVEKAPSLKPEKSSSNDAMAIDAATGDGQKRKRSASPPPEQEAVAKRARNSGESADASIAPAVRMTDQPDTGRADRMDVVADHGAPAAGDSPRKGDDVPNRDDAMDLQRDVAPAIHPATSALYIANLMRPLRPADMQTHLIDLATGPAAPLNDDIITQFHLDQIRTHAFVVFTSTSAASRVRALLHDCVWPNESNRKALFVDFIPPEKFQAWIDTETGGGGRPGTRWEVVYSDAPDGSVEARLESAAAAAAPFSRPPGPPPASAPSGPRLTSDSANNIPLGPRGGRAPSSSAPQPPPTGPRPKRSGPGPFPPRDSGPGRRTQTYPAVSYSTVPEDLARRRVSNMRSFYTDRRGPYGREINRYSFEDGDSFVDRGKEVFEGIRPPHRERGGRRGGRGGRGGGGGGEGRGGFGGRPPRRPRPRSDRYLPGGGGGGGGGGPPPPPRRDDRW